MSDFLNSVIPTGADHRKAMIWGVEGPAVVMSPGCDGRCGAVSGFRFTGRVAHSSPVLVWVGMFTRHRLSPTNKLDCPHAMGTNAFSPQRAESFRHFLLPPSPSAIYHGCKSTNLRVSLGAGAAQFQASGLRVRSHAEHVHLLLSEPQQDTLADALKEARSSAAFD
jgi:hypothetical protein